MVTFKIDAETKQYARQKDLNDPLKNYKKQFHIPKDEGGQDQLYLCGNSLGLQPISTINHVRNIMDSWKYKGVEGHFTGPYAWIDYYEEIPPLMAEIVGAKASEISIMNTLTVNLHLMLVSFYRPSREKYKILIDYSPFPSDRYAIYSHLRSRGIDPESAVLELVPSNGEIVTKSDIDEILETHGDEIALVMMGGINYYTGQLYPLSYITKKAKSYGCMVGFDLAHAAGNVTLKLHDWGVDFAVWCTYKYLNAGPGNLSGCFIHTDHHDDTDIQRYVGWWGYRKEERFLMKNHFVPEPGASGWIISNPPVICLAGIQSSLHIFRDAHMDRLVEKSRELTRLMERLIIGIDHPDITIITPSDPDQRGCQLSIKVSNADRSLFNKLRTRGVVGDWREPDVIRVAPTPLYNSFLDVFRFAEILENILVA